MKVLQLCIRVPSPPNDGATIAMYNISRSLLSRQVQLKILSFNTNKSYVPVDKIEPSFRQATGIETIDLNLRINPVDAFFNLFTNRSFHIERFRSSDFTGRLIQLLKNNDFDVVLFEGLFMTPYLETVRKHTSACAILRSHNVEFVIWERLAKACRHPLKRAYLNLLAQRLKRYEIRVMNKFDALLPITPVDERHYRSLGCTIPMLTLPLGVNAGDYPAESSGRFSLFHLGSMDWMPNLEAVNWFLDSVYPLLIKAIPDLTVYLAGKEMPERIFNLADRNLIVEGRVNNSKEYMKDKPVMIVPLLSGGGMRVKIIEGMAAGKAIVSTSVGAEGIEYTNGENILIADTPQQFADAILMLYRNPNRIQQIGSSARRLVETNYDNDVLGKKLVDFLKQQAGI